MAGRGSVVVQFVEQPAHPDRAHYLICLGMGAVRLVEIYQSPSQNLAGLYIAPAGKDTGQVFLIKFPEGFTVIGPQSAVSAVATDPNVRAKLTLNPNWIPGNILL